MADLKIKAHATNDRHGKKGLWEKIRDAKTDGEAQSLLAKGSGYPNASAKTKRRWERSAARKRG